MSKPFDVTTKYLLQADPAAWLALASLVPDGELTVLDTDLSTVSAVADAVIRIDGPEPWLVHLEFQSSKDDLLVSRLLRYNVLSSYRHELPVLSVVILLRREADKPTLSELYQSRLPDGQVVLEFRYRVVRVWEVPVETILHGGLATLPMAPLADLGNTPLPRLIEQLAERIDREASIEEAGEIWTATYVLMGLSYSTEETETLLRGVRAMNESVTFQAILEQGREQGREQGLEQGREQGLEQGRLQEAVTLLFKFGRKQFGAASPSVVTSIEQITDLSRIEQLHERLHEVKSWDELLASRGKGNGND